MMNYNPVRIFLIIAIVLCLLPQVNACSGVDYVALTPSVRTPTLTFPTDPPGTLEGSLQSTPTLEEMSLQRTSAPSVTETLIQEDCFQAVFIQDVTVADGTAFGPEQIFLKVWRLQNSGTCEWPLDLEFVFLAGNLMGGQSILPTFFYPEGLPLIASLGERNWADARVNRVLPGESIDIPLLLQAPLESGEYFSLWALRSPELGDELIQVYVQIQVEGPETPEPKTWGGLWHQRNDLAVGTSIVHLEQQGVKIQGYFYTPQGQLYLLEGGLFEQGRRVEGTYGPPYEDGFPFTWLLAEEGDQFQGSFRDRIISAGAWCGARELVSIPVPCGIQPE
jgi:hypothetical protein